MPDRESEVAAAREAARVLVHEHNLGDMVYHVRGRVEGELPPGVESTWHHPKVVSFARAVETLRAFADGAPAPVPRLALCGAELPPAGVLVPTSNLPHCWRCAVQVTPTEYVLRLPTLVAGHLPAPEGGAPTVERPTPDPAAPAHVDWSGPTPVAWHLPEGAGFQPGGGCTICGSRTGTDTTWRQADGRWYHACPALNPQVGHLPT